MEDDAEKTQPSSVIRTNLASFPPSNHLQSNTLTSPAGPLATELDNGSGINLEISKTGLFVPPTHAIWIVIPNKELCCTVRIVESYGSLWLL